VLASVHAADYLQFTLYKRNKDTSVVLNQLAAALKVPASLFSYADAKDKRGISTQLCTVYRVTKERAQQVFKPAPLRALDDQAHLVGDLRFTHHKLQLGDCRGNHIAVAIRSLPNEDVLPENQVGDSVAAWKTHGFINFFGLPRFGTTGPTSYHLIGRAMLRKDFKLAVLLLLRPQEGEASKIREAREHFRQHKDVAAALRMLPPFLVAERAILEGLQQNGIEAHELAFRNVPKPIRVAYVEAYQHYVWNEMASLRMSKECDSTAAMVGDLVLVSSSSEDDGSGPPKKKYKKALTKRVVRQAVATLTAESVAQYSIDDVVLPVPGHAVVYPDNAVGAAYRKMLATDGIDMSAHFEPDGSQQFALDGYYRHVVQKPTSVSFRLARYDDPTVPLIETDVDRLLKKYSADGNDSSDRKSDEKGGEDKRPAHRALVLEFELGYGSDATVALRELMKQSSSVHVSWQQGGSSDFVATENGSSASTTAEKNVGESAAKASTATEKPAKKTKKLAKSEPRKVITAQKKTQVAIGRPGFSLGRS
jgi:tRNA pseudouridine13 synthase